MYEYKRRHESQCHRDGTGPAHQPVENSGEARGSVGSRGEARGPAGKRAEARVADGKPWEMRAPVTKRWCAISYTFLCVSSVSQATNS